MHGGDTFGGALVSEFIVVTAAHAIDIAESDNLTVFIGSDHLRVETALSQKLKVSLQKISLCVYP